MSEAMKTRKSSTLMVGFVLAILFSFIYVIFYSLLTEPLYRYLSIPGMDLLTSFVHSLIVSVLGTAVCCLFFFQRKKRLVPVAYAWMTFFVLIAYLLSAFYFEGVRRTNLLAVLSLFCLMPLFVGNLTAWLLYRRLDRPTGD